VAPDLAALCSGVQRGEDGIWYTGGRSQVSFPAAGHAENQDVEDCSFWFRHRNLCILELISLYPPPRGGIIFDVGGGNGFVSAAIHNAEFRVVLVEPGLPGVQNARARGVENIICGTLEEAGFRPGSLDAAGLFDVLEHIEHDREFLSGLRALIARNGRLYLTVPAYQNLWSSEDDYAGHFRRYTAGSLAEVLAAAGFGIDFSTYIFRWLPVPVFLMRTLPYRLSVEKKSLRESDTISDHQVDREWVGRLMDTLFSTELARIRRQSRMRFGGSILVAASAR
jgi:SAM-dependent methyltransferase